jgi:hypothetical protein
MEQVMEVMAAQIIPAIAVALATLVSVGLVRLNKWLKMKTGSEAVAAAGEIVAATVNELTATTVKNMKAAADDSKLTMDEALMIKNQAVSLAKSQLPPAVAKAAALAVGDLSVFISGKIEQTVAEGKSQKSEI